MPPIVSSNTINSGHVKSKRRNTVFATTIAPIHREYAGSAASFASATDAIAFAVAIHASRDSVRSTLRRQFTAERFHSTVGEATE